LQKAEALRKQGHRDEALELYQFAAELYAELDDPEAEQGATLARLAIDRLQRLPELEAILSGAQMPETAEDWTAAIDHGYETRRFADVVALTERTLEEAPQLVRNDPPEHSGTYNSACAAALLAADEEVSEEGGGAKDVEAREQERARLRELARAWLLRAVEEWKAALQEGGDRVERVRTSLQWSLEDPDFEGLRDKGIEALPAGEREAWREVWVGVEAAAEPG
jgi:hypothetical protein